MQDSKRASRGVLDYSPEELKEIAGEALEKLEAAEPWIVDQDMAREVRLLIERLRRGAV